MNTTEFCKKNNIRISAEYADTNKNAQDWKDADHWKITLKFGKKRMTTYFSQGYAHKGNEPEVDSVIDCLASDAMCAGGTFENFCSDLGYDEDSRKAERIYKACLKGEKQLRAFLGEDLFADLLDCEKI